MSHPGTPPPAASSDAYAQAVSIDAACDLADALLQAVAQMAKLHGDDPHMATIVTTGFALAINRIGERIDPAMPHIVRELIK